MTSADGGRTPENNRFAGALFALAGGLLLLTAWFAPAWIVPAAAAVFAAGLAIPAVRAAVTWPAFLACAGVVGFFWIKDRLMAGPLEAVVGALGVPVEFHIRQPDTVSAAGQLASLGACLLVLPVLRVLAGGERRLLGWMRVVVLVLAGLAAAVLTHPSATADYGQGRQLGEVVSRNAAAGAFAIGAILAAGLAVAAMREGRSREWPPALVAGGLCAAAVAGLGSRGGLFALVAGAGCLVLRLGGRRSRLTLAGLAVLVVGVMLAAPATLARLADLGNEYRVELWTASMRALRHAPWGGLGAGGFEAGFALLGGVIPDEGMRVTHPDSSWVLLLAEWGVAGVAVMVWAVRSLVRGASEPHRGDALRTAALAALVAWAVASLGDIALHRPVGLALGLPVFAALFPLKESRRLTGGCRAIAAALVLAMCFAGAAVWANQMKRRVDDPARIDERVAQWVPLDRRVNHVLGLKALAGGDLDAAARRFTLVAALDPANTEAFAAYGRALMPSRPDLALPFWRRLLVVSGPRASQLLTGELERRDGEDAVYWMRAAEVRPELWVVPADTDRAGAQRCYERWLMQPAPVRARSRVMPALGAMARWGGMADLADWLKTGPGLYPSEIAPAGRMLRARGRADLAWMWLDNRFPRSGPAKAEADPGLKARVLANPDDPVAAARLLDQTPPGEESLRLLERLAARPGAPAAFRLRLARALHEHGRREEALDVMLAAADAQAAAGR